MGRPKRPRKPGKRALARRRREDALKARGALTFVDGTGSVSFMSWTPVVSIADWTRAWSPGGVRPITIESLDEGVTWHAADTLEPAANNDGQLVIGAYPCGAAPECMRAGSGIYSFEVEHRWATDEEVDAWMRENELRNQAMLEEHRAMSREASDKISRARSRARQLLMSHLSPSQQRDFEELDGFWVTSELGNLYWVTPRTAVRFDKDGRALQHYCIHAEDHSIPPEDNALARMLVLKCDEEMFLRAANPGTPSEWDFAPVRTALVGPAVDLVVQEPMPHPNPPVRVLPNCAGVATVTASSSSALNVIATTENFEVVRHDEADRANWIQISRPIMLYTNGVVRPITG